MIDECKELEKTAKGLEKENPMDAIALYKKTASCLDKNGNLKGYRVNLEKAAKLYRQLAKMNEDPERAFKLFNQASDIFTDIGMTSLSKKVIQEANQKFIDTAWKIRTESKKIKDLNLTELNLAKASNYASQANEEALSIACWVDSGDYFRRKANRTKNPRDAFKLYKRALLNYEVVDTENRKQETLKNAADKFYDEGNTYYRRKKDLVSAIDNFVQANTLYSYINENKKAETAETRIKDLCATIGLPKEFITEYLEKKNFKSITF